jgi:hypothetical protein
MKKKEARHVSPPVVPMEADRIWVSQSSNRF